MRLFLFACFFALSGMFACSTTGTNNNNNNSTSVKECDNPGDCWKKICPQEDKTEYGECVQKRVNTQIQGEGPDNNKPEYLTCTSDNKCQDISTDTLGGGVVTAVLKPEGTRIQWLRLMIFASKDLAGKPITCSRLKKMATDKPASLMDLELRRYWPARDAAQPITTEVKRQQGRSLPLLFGTNPVTVPAGKHVFVIQGFCNPKEGGSPVADTTFQWWFCKEGVETVKGDKNDITIDFDTTQNPSCPPG